LQSVLFKSDDYRNIELIKSGSSDSMIEASKSVALKLAQGYKFRSQQVKIVRQQLDTSPIPRSSAATSMMFPIPYTYFKIKG
jgi:hypothetical protein